MLHHVLSAQTGLVLYQKLYYETNTSVNLQHFQKLKTQQNVDWLNKHNILTLSDNFQFCIQVCHLFGQ